MAQLERMGEDVGEGFDLVKPGERGRGETKG